MTTQERIKDTIKRYLTNDRNIIFCRAADDNFEMGDGSEVTVGVYKAALKDPRLMELLLIHNGKENIEEWKALYLKQPKQLELKL